MNSAPFTPPYVTCHIGCQPHYPLDNPPKPSRPNQQRLPLHAPLPPHQKEIPHPGPMTNPPLSTTSTPLCTAHTTTPGLEKCSATPKLYAKAFPHSWEAEQFRAGKYDLSKFTPATQHPDYKPKHLPTYAQAASSGRPARGKKTKKASATEVAHPVGEPSKTATSLTFASRRFFAIRETPLPHPLAARITKTFPDIVATTLTDSNCLLPKGFRVKVNARGAVSLTGTDPLTPAESFAPYFDAITRRLNQSYPTGSSPWLSFSSAKI